MSWNYPTQYHGTIRPYVTGLSDPLSRDYSAECRGTIQPKVTRLSNTMTWDYLTPRSIYSCCIMTSQMADPIECDDFFRDYVDHDTRVYVKQG